MRLKLFEGTLAAPEYDREIAALPRAGIYQASSWADVRRPTHDAHRIIVMRDGCPVLSAQILTRSMRGGCRVMTLPRGPIGDLSDRAGMGTLAGALRALGRRLNAVVLFMDPCVPEGGREAENLLALGVRRRRGERGLFGGNLPRRVWRVPLGPSPGDALSHLRPETRRICSRAARMGLSVRAGGMGDFHRLKRWLFEHARERRYSLPREVFLDRLFDVWQRNGQARIFVCEHDGRTLSMALATEFAGEVHGHFAADGPGARELGANRLLHLRIMEHAERHGILVYDMGGVAWNPELHPEAAGLRLFKSGFGGTEESYVGEMELVLSHGIYAAITAAWSMAHRRIGW